MSLPVIITHWNAPDWCRSSTRNILASDLPVSVTVVDNSGDLDGLDHRVRVLRPGRNLGFTGGANLGIREWISGTDEEFCLVGAHDLHVAEHTIRQLVEAATSDPRIGIAGPTFDGDEVSDDIADVPWLVGAALLLRRACVEEIGGFDEDFGSYVEDVELCHRASAAGWRVVKVRGAVANGLGTVSPRAFKLMYENDLLYSAKREGWLGLGRGVVRTLKIVVYQVLVGFRRSDERARLWNRAGWRIRSLGPGAYRAARWLRQSG